MELLGLEPGVAVGQALDALEEEVEAGEVTTVDGGAGLPAGVVGGARRGRGGPADGSPRRRLMPELPEVETVRRRLLTCLPGLLVRDVVVNDATVSAQSEAELRALLAGRRVTGLRRRGKYLIVDFGGVEGASRARRAGMPAVARPRQAPPRPSSTCA